VQEGETGAAAAQQDRPEQAVIAVVGPTATGKSDLGLALAEALAASGSHGAEIVNADAMQLYRGLDIGTAKLPDSQRRGIVHHQIDILAPGDVASVAAYQAAARADVAAIQARDHRPIVVGGSGLYVRALLDHLEFPGTNAEVRAGLEDRAARHGTRALYQQLLSVDPKAAEAIGPRNTRRIIRALEAIAVTGRPFSATLPRAEYVQPTLVIGLDADRAWLDDRIERRVASMWAAGLRDEVRGLADPAHGGVGPGLGVTAARAVGYAETIELLLGRVDEAQTLSAIEANTRRLARKQMGWFGRDQRIRWLDAAAPDLVDQAVELVGRFDGGFLPTADSPHLPRAEPNRRPLGSVGD